MASNFVPIADIHGDRQQLNLRVRVIRLWAVPAFNNANVVGSIEMLFIDEKGDKIQCTVRRPLVYRFQPLLTEGRCYNIYSVAVVPNLGSYRTTKHDSRLLFHVRTTVTPTDIPTIPLHGVNPTPFNDILSDSIDADYLIDVVGLLTGMSKEKDYEKDGKTGKMVVLEPISEKLNVHYLVNTWIKYVH